MPEERHLPPGHVITFPNREKPASHLTRVLVVAGLVVSVVLMLAVTIGGWSKLQGLSGVNFIWCFVYVAMAFFVSRWARGLLPIAAGLAVLLFIISLIAGFGGVGTSWFQRNHVDYSAAHSIFGGAGLSPDTLGTLVFLIAPVQLLLIVLTMVGFSQAWNVEVERLMDGYEEETPPQSPSASAGLGPRGAEPQLG